MSTHETWLNFGRLHDRQTPFALVDESNLIFKREVRRVRWPTNSDAIAKAERFWYPAAHILGWCFVILATLRGMLGPWISMAAFFMLVGVGVLADIFSVVLSLGRIHRDTLAAEWDTLRLTGLAPEDILIAKLAAAQVRAWPLVILETLTRLLGTEFMLLTVVNSRYLGAIGLCGPVFATCLIMVAFLMPLSVLEPIWRIRTITILATLLGIRVKDGSKALFYVVGLLLGLALLRLPVIALYTLVLFGIPSITERGQAMMIAVLLFSASAPLGYFVSWLLHVAYTRLSIWGWKTTLHELR